MTNIFGGQLAPPDFNLSAAICRELERSDSRDEPLEIAERVARQIPDGCLRAVLVHELLPRRVVSEADGRHARRVAAGEV